MFTCVIPTLWKSRRIFELVDDLVHCPCVGEVIIIDNAPQDSMQLQISTSSKLRILKMEKNIFVNPAWNLGVKEAKFEDVALINDDVNFNTDVFKLFDNGSLKHLGIVGMAQENYELSEDQEFKLDSCTRHLGWGCMILIAKERYVPVPDDLLIWCGDDWLSKHRATFQVSGLKVETEMSTTTEHSNVNFEALMRRDWFTWNEKYKDTHGK